MIELKSYEMINRLREKAIERIIKYDDAELFSLIEDKNIEEAFMRNKYQITIPLKDERVEKIPNESIGNST